MGNKIPLNVQFKKIFRNFFFFVALVFCTCKRQNSVSNGIYRLVEAPQVVEYCGNNIVASYLKFECVDGCGEIGKIIEPLILCVDVYDFESSEIYEVETDTCVSCILSKALVYADNEKIKETELRVISVKKVGTFSRE